jgi:DNA-binding IclR family transcriptional regulator
MPRSGTKTTRSGSRPPQMVSALERGIAVLRCIELSGGPLSNGEISRRTGIPKPTVTRLVATLVALNYLKQASDTDKFSLSAGVVSLARAFLAGLDVRATARPHMVELAETARASVYLAIRDGLEMVLIEVCRSRSTVLLSRLDLGSRLSIAESALGRAYLSGLDLAKRHALLDRLRIANGANWPRVAPGLEQALENAAKCGYCLSAGEWHPDIHSIAVPLLAPTGELMAVNCGGPAFAFPADHLCNVIAPKLIETAKAIARDIGGTVPGVAGTAKATAKADALSIQAGSRPHRADRVDTIA